MGGSNMFKLVVTAAWHSNQMRSFHIICGVDLEVESKIRRSSTSSCTDGNMSRDSQNLDKSGSISGGGSGRLGQTEDRLGGGLHRKTEETHGREERNGWWKTHLVKQRAEQEQHGNSSGELHRDAQSRHFLSLPDAMPLTVSESSVESFLKGVRSQVETKEEKKVEKVESFLKGVRSLVEMKGEKVEHEEVLRVKEERNEGEHKTEGRV